MAIHGRIPILERHITLLRAVLGLSVLSSDRSEMSSAVILSFHGRKRLKLDHYSRSYGTDHQIHKDRKGPPSCNWLFLIPHLSTDIP